jgi:hypothetical protein
MAFRSLGETLASPSWLRSVFYARSMTRATPRGSVRSYFSFLSVG